MRDTIANYSVLKLKYHRGGICINLKGDQEFFLVTRLKLLKSLFLEIKFDDGHYTALENLSTLIFFLDFLFRYIEIFKIDSKKFHCGFKDVHSFQKFYFHFLQFSYFG